MSDIYQALARTALLVELDIFGPGADHHAITDRANIDTPAGQTDLVTLYALLAMQGLQIDLDVPITPMRSGQPPLRGTSLPASLLDYSADLLPGGSARPAPAPDVTFALGDTPAPPGAVRVTGTGWTAAAGMAGPGPDGGATDRPGRWPRPRHPKDCAPLCPALPSASAARPRAPAMADPPRPARRPGPDPYHVDEPVAAGDVDVISGGAITSAALYALLRMPVATVSLRIIDPDVPTLPNYNRYALARRSMFDSPRVHALVACETSSITITGHQQRLDDTTAMRLGPSRRGCSSASTTSPPGGPPSEPRPEAGSASASGEGSQVGNCQVERVRPVMTFPFMHRPDRATIPVPPTGHGPRRVWVSTSPTRNTILSVSG